MPIKGWTDGARLPRIGDIALGYIDESNNAPKAVDYFVVPKEVQDLYGEKPRELDIMIPHEDLEVIMPAYLKRYGDKFGLICRGDGETAHLSVNYGNLAEYGVVWQNGSYVSKDTGEVLAIETIKGKGIYGFLALIKNVLPTKPKSAGRLPYYPYCFIRCLAVLAFTL